MEKYNLEELQKFFDENQLPENITKSQTVFDIMKQPHLENVWSNIYAFFFDPNKEHMMGSVFINSLVELISEKSNGRIFTDKHTDSVNIITEDSTVDSKRLDIAIQSKEFAILIENKVRATLYNDLGKYWRNYPHYDDKDKQGVVLSLHPVIISVSGEGEKLGHNPENWVNITHYELIKRINNNLLNRYDTTNKYHQFYQEFYQNIINMTRPIDNKSLEFYWNNREKISQINELSYRVEDAVKKQIAEAMQSIDFMGYYELNHCKGLYFYKDNSKKGRNKQHCVISVFLKELYSQNPHIVVTVEILGKEFIQKCIDEMENSQLLSAIFDKDKINTKNDWEQVNFYIPISICKEQMQEVGRLIVDECNNKIVVLDKTIAGVYDFLDNLYRSRLKSIGRSNI